MEKAEQLLFEIKEEFTEKVYAWRRANRILIPTEAEMVHLQRTVNQYPEKSYDDLIAVVRAVRKEQDKKRLTAISNLSAAKEGRIEALQSKEAELAEWLDKKDPEPTCKAEVLRNRARLKEVRLVFPRTGPPINTFSPNCS